MFSLSVTVSFVPLLHCRSLPEQCLGMSLGNKDILLPLKIFERVDIYSQVMPRRDLEMLSTKLLTNCHAKKPQPHLIFNYFCWWTDVFTQKIILFNMTIGHSFCTCVSSKYSPAKFRRVCACSGLSGETNLALQDLILWRRSALRIQTFGLPADQ